MKTIKYIVLSLLMGSSGLAALAQQTDTIKYTTPTQIETFNGSTFHTTRRHFDGLGRLVQSIDVGASAQNGRDVVSFVEYDNMGRGDAKIYLPYVVSSAANNGARIPNPAASQQAFYQGYLPSTDPDRNYAYAQKQYDSSPLGVIVKEGGIGQGNNLTVGTSINHEYSVDNSGAIKKFTVNTNGDLVYKGYYYPGTLSVSRTFRSGANGDDRDTYEYIDPTGQPIASEVRVSSADRRITYYVYDDFGRQRYIIPPIQESQITAVGSVYTPEQLQKYCYAISYDARGNKTAQWDPTGGRTVYAYDQFDRAILSQDRKLSETGKWGFVKYDGQNRPIISGVIPLQGDVTSLTTELRNYLAGDMSGRRYESRDNNNVSGYGYTNNCYPSHVSGGNPQAQVLNITYYDDYDWITDAAKYGFSASDAIAGTARTTNNVIGMITGTKTKVLGISGDQWLTSVTYYDNEHKAIQMVSDLYPSGVEIASNKHNFSGQIVQTKVKQVVDGVTYEYNKWFDYDGYGRLLKVRQKITGDAQNEIVLLEYAYDDLGKVVSKKIHGGKETTSYAYDIAGRNIATTSPSFSYKIGYDKSLISGVAGRTDGLVSQITWSNNATGEQKAYAYTYDKMKQYLSASYYEKSGSSWTASAKYKETIGGYDKAGNILSLQRNNSSGALMHNYTYTYGHSTNGYALTKVSGSADFLYDSYGNMTKDGMTGVQIEYNILNLPLKIYKGADQITYVYSANGRKLASQIGNTQTYYRNMIIYTKNGTSAEQLMYIHQPEGIVAKEGSAWVYKYFKTDYLGNTRALLAVRNGSLVNEGQNTDYYPLGYAHSLANLHLNKYLYGGKEYQDASIGGAPLGLYDFGARYYNPLLGRWFCPDPANQIANPYVYCGNNPIMYIDPDGQFFFSFISSIIAGMIFNATVAAISTGGDPSSIGTAVITGALGGAVGAGVGSLLTYGGAGFIGAAVTGGTVGFVGGAAGSWVNGASFGQGIKAGLVSGGSGALLGGLVRGALDKAKGYTFWRGIKVTGEITATDPASGQDYDAETRKAMNKDLKNDPKELWGVEPGWNDLGGYSVDLDNAAREKGYVPKGGKFENTRSIDPQTGKNRIVDGFTLTSSAGKSQVFIAPDVAASRTTGDLSRYAVKGTTLSCRYVSTLGHELVHVENWAAAGRRMEDAALYRAYTENAAYKFSRRVYIDYPHMQLQIDNLVKANGWDLYPHRGFVSDVIR